MAADIARTRDAGDDEITLWPNTTMSGAKGVSYQKKEILKQRLLGEDHAQNTLPFKRLKTAMDAWCALWLWPIEKADKLPSRQEFLEGMRILLEGGFSVDGSLSAGAEDDFAVVMGDLFDLQVAEPTAKYNVGLFQETNVEAFIEEYDWLQVATEVANEARFVHYDLIFADILKKRGGFDLIVGNPPWAKSDWSIKEEIADLDPIYKGGTAAKLTCNLKNIIDSSGKLKSLFFSRYELSNGVSNFISNGVNYPLSSSGSKNLYRNFIENSWRLISGSGVSGLIHMDAHLGTPNNDALRKVWYQRVRKHFEFSNQITLKNFSEVKNTKWFSLNIYGCPREANFISISSCFLASQVDDCFDSDGAGEVKGLKVDGKWNTEGHQYRLVKVDQEYLRNIGRLFGDKNNPRLFKPYDKNEKSIITKLVSNDTVGNIFKDLKFCSGISANKLVATELACKNDFVEQANSSIVFITPSHVSTITPFFKEFREGGVNYKHYDCINPRIFQDSFRPRSPITLKSGIYVKDVTECSGGEGCYKDYSFAFKSWVDSGAERTLVGFIAPENFIVSENFMKIYAKNSCELLKISGFLSSIHSDFLVKRLKIEHIYESTISNLPCGIVGDAIKERVLILSAQTSDYAQLIDDALPLLKHSVPHFYNDEIFSPIKDKLHALTSEKRINLSLLERKLIEIEIDSLISLALNINDIELQEILKAFSLLVQNENSTYYDLNGDIVYSAANSLRSLGLRDSNGLVLSNQKWQDTIKNYVCFSTFSEFKPGVEDNLKTLVKIEREAEYLKAYDHFKKFEQEGAA